MVFGLFGSSTAFKATDLPDLAGKTVIITGASAGLGKASTEALVKKGAHVIMAVRSVGKGQEVAADIKTRVPSATIDVMELDLASFASVSKFASDFLARNLPIHCLLNNAGIMALPEFKESQDGIELQFASNHCGHFLLTLLLLPRIEETAKRVPVTIVNVSSMGHQFTTRNGIDFEKIADKSSYNSFAFYGQSKLANILFTRELQKRLDKKIPDNKIYVSSLHPGVVNTNLATASVIPTFLANLAGGLITQPDDGALTQLYCSFSPEIVEKNYRGQYFVPTAKLATPSAYALDDALATKLWEWSENIVAQKGFPVAKL
ncbi:hypothetical protein HDU96_009186 [Phlyctochytrium bullatum]|nr:hypothetical protein HDU96_009186 [Phlyctochytrium bullatum]